MRPRRGIWLVLMLAWCCAGCIVAESGSTATAAPPPATATQTLAPLAVPPSATAIAIVTSTPRASDTPEPASATATPFASPSQALPVPTNTPTPTGAAPVASATPPPAVSPTFPPAATAPPISIISFSITPDTINPGDAVTLTWQTTGEKVAIYRQDPGGPLDDMHLVPPSGSLTVQSPPGQRGRLDYVLYATARNSTAIASVSAIIRCTDKWFFANPPAICPLPSSGLVQMAAEHFEHGLMLWSSAGDQIYILYADRGQPGWDQRQNAWFAGQPESDPTLTPPAGLFQPVRGFGVAWRKAPDSFSPAARDRLGWATDAESSLTGAYQCDSAPKYTTCYISGPGDVVYLLGPERSDWKVWQGP